MFKSIVVGTDGSETADIALRRAIELAALTGGKLHVVSAYEPAPGRVGGNKPVPEAAEWSVGSDFKVEAVLQRAQAEARGRSGDFEGPAPRWTPADSLLAAAREHAADLIVLGRRGMRGPRRVLGSVPNKVSHNAP